MLNKIERWIDNKLYVEAVRHDDEMIYIVVGFYPDENDSLTVWFFD